MPARHTSLEERFASRSWSDRLWSTKEGVGETSGQTAGSSFREFALRKTVRQKKQVFFVRCGSLWSAISSGPKPAVKSGPDVFDDALVPRSPNPDFLPLSLLLRHCCFPGNLRILFVTRAACRRRPRLPAGARSDCGEWLSFAEIAG